MRHILLVDDDERIRRMVRQALESRGFSVVEACNGREALGLWEARAPDLVLTDINMPEMDGIELLLAVLKRSEGVPVVAMSGGGLIPQELLLGNAKLLGAVEVLAKPFTLPELIDALLVAFQAAPGLRGS